MRRAAGAIAAGLLAALASPGPALAAGPTVAVRAETRVRCDLSDAAAPQGLGRGVIGAELRATPDMRVFGELGTGRSVGRPGVGPNFQNEVALQQLYVDVHGRLGPARVGAAVGRMEHAEGPRQLVSVADGPNLHRSWNGVRLALQAGAMRLSAFELRATRLAPGGFDDGIDPAERLGGLAASLEAAPGLRVDPFWLRSENPSGGGRARPGPEDRDSYGMRAWGAWGAASVDWVLARQTGRSLDRPVDAWGLFAAQSLRLADHGWRPRLGVRLDLATGGDAARAGFHQLYASSNYVSEGLFLSTSNLLLLTPSLTLAPTPSTGLTLEAGLARRLAEGDAAYAGLMRPYAGTERVSGHALGGLLRLAGRWAVTEHLDLGVVYEHLAAGEVLRQAGAPSGHYGSVRTTFRY